MWPAFWAVKEADQIKPLPPEQVYDITRRALRVRKNFVEELLKPRLSSTDLKEILGEDRAQDQRRRVDRRKNPRRSPRCKPKKGREQFDEKVDAALAAIEEELGAQNGCLCLRRIYLRSR